MWKYFIALLQSLFLVSRDVEELRRDVKALNERFFHLAAVVQSLSDKIDAAAMSESRKGNTRPFCSSSPVSIPHWRKVFVSSGKMRPA